MATILGSSKFTDACESVLYKQVREKLDAECAAAPDEYREALEDVADLLGEHIRNDSRNDSALCQMVLSGDKTLTGAYEEMRETVRKRVKTVAGKITCGAMSSREAERIIYEYYGFNAVTETVEAEATPEPVPVTPEAAGTVSIFDLFD